MKRSVWLLGVIAILLAVSAIGLTGCGSKASGSTSNSSSSSSTSELSGSLNVEGSDTMVNLANSWAEQFMTANPNVNISVKGGGSGNGIAALINGTTDFANASRQMKAEEISQAKAKGVNPVETAVARDGIAVIVNPANPVTGLTIDQLGKIYRGEITNWSKVGGADASIGPPCDTSASCPRAGLQKNRYPARSVSIAWDQPSFKNVSAPSAVNPVGAVGPIRSYLMAVYLYPPELLPSPLLMNMK